MDHGYLLMNLGSPDSTSVSDVRRYLNEFLMDERVIDMPYLKRLLLVKGIITPFRAPKSAAAYKTIWTEKGSPLLVISHELRAAVEKELEAPVELCMRYGNPGPKEALNKLRLRIPGLKKVTALPLYPHYAMSSFETAVEHVKKAHKELGFDFSLSFVDAYYNDSTYIQALAESMKPYLNQPYDHILFSYHGIPARHLAKTDSYGHCLGRPDCCTTPSPAHKTCYRHQCFETTRLVTTILGIPTDKFSISFQSRLGKGWLEPFTDKRLEVMPSEGIRNLLILCPAFVSDCLETLEEIEERGKEIFMEAGGSSYQMIPCMNVHPAWVQTVKKLLKEAV